MEKLIASWYTMLQKWCGENHIATPSLVAHTIQQKFCMGIPANRMERELYSAGLVISRAKLSYWIIRCSEEFS